MVINSGKSKIQTIYDVIIRYELDIEHNGKSKLILSVSFFRNQSTNAFFFKTRILLKHRIGKIMLCVFNIMFKWGILFKFTFH